MLYLNLARSWSGVVLLLFIIYLSGLLLLLLLLVTSTLDPGVEAVTVGIRATGYWSLK